MRRARCRTCRLKENDSGIGSFGIVEFMTIFSGLYAMKELRKDWKQYKQKKGIGDMSLYEFHKKHKEGTLEGEAAEIASKLFRERVECASCGKRKPVSSFKVRI